jgi:hypothetical protein
MGSPYLNNLESFAPILTDLFNLNFYWFIIGSNCLIIIKMLIKFIIFHYILLLNLIWEPIELLGPSMNMNIKIVLQLKEIFQKLRGFSQYTKETISH